MLNTSMARRQVGHVGLGGDDPQAGRHRRRYRRLRARAFRRSARGGEHPHLAAVILLALLTLAALAQLAIRFTQRETISLVFAVLNLLGHLGLLFALLHVPDPRTLPLIFRRLLGRSVKLIKLQFLRVTGYTEGGANTSAMLRTSVIMAVLYALFVIFLLL